MSGSAGGTPISAEDLRSLFLPDDGHRAPPPFDLYPGALPPVVPLALAVRVQAIDRIGPRSTAYDLPTVNNGYLDRAASPLEALIAASAPIMIHSVPPPLLHGVLGLGALASLRR